MPPPFPLQTKFGGYIGITLSICLSVHFTQRLLFTQGWFWPKVIWTSSRSPEGKVQYSCQVYILRMEKHLKFLLQTMIAYGRMVSWFWPKFIWAVSRSLEESSFYWSAHTFILKRHWKFLLHIDITYELWPEGGHLGKFKVIGRKSSIHSFLIKKN